MGEAVKKSTFLSVIVASAFLPAASVGAFGQSKPGLPVALVDPGPVGAATTTAIFSHFAVGGGYTTVFTLQNTGAGSVDGNLILTSQDSTPFNASMQSSDGSSTTGSLIHILIPQGGTTFVTASPSNPADQTTRAGWARVESSGGVLGGVSTFQFNSGGLQTIAGVLSSSAVSSATIPVDNDLNAQRFTGYAIANTGSSIVNIKIVVVDLLGTIVNSISTPQLNPLPPGQQVARFLHQDLPNLTTFRGSMVLIAQGTGTFNVVALVQAQNATGGILFTAIPVLQGNAPNIN